MTEFLTTNTGFHDVQYWQIALVFVTYLSAVIYSSFNE